MPRTDDKELLTYLLGGTWVHTGDTPDGSRQYRDVAPIQPAEPRRIGHEPPTRQEPTMPTPDPTVVDRLTAELAHHINALDVICARINYPSLTVREHVDKTDTDCLALIGSAEAETELARQNIAEAVTRLNRARSRTLRATSR